MRSGIILYSADNQWHIFFATSGGKACWSLERRHVCICTIFRPVYSVFIYQCWWQYGVKVFFKLFYITWLVLGHDALLLLLTSGKPAFILVVANGHPNKSIKVNESSLFTFSLILTEYPASTLLQYFQLKCWRTCGATKEAFFSKHTT